MTREQAEQYVREYLGNTATRIELQSSPRTRLAIERLLVASERVAAQGGELKSRQAITAILVCTLY